MKLFVVLSFVAYTTASKLENAYLPPSSAQTAGGSGSILSTPFNLVPSSQITSSIPRFTGAILAPRTLYAAPVATVNAYSGPATTPVPIVKLISESGVDGSYKYEYETANHIAAQESGRLVAPDSSEVLGSYSYLAPNGETISVNYIANENGFQPAGDHLPTSPPIPEAILKSLELNAAAEARGIFDDGQYKPSGLVVATQYSAPVINAQYLPPVSQSGGYKY